MQGPSWNDIPADLLARLAAGDAAALGPLASWITDHPPPRTSEDLRQKVLITLCRLMSNERGKTLLKSASSIPNFLAAVAKRHRSDERREDLRLRQFVEKAARRSLRSQAPDPPSIVSQGEIAKTILASVARLQPLEREALVRALVLDESYRSIAHALFKESRGVLDEQRLRKLVCRARRKLQARLKGLRSG